VNWLRDLFDRLLDWDEQHRCHHSWRPAKKGTKPARCCRICEKVEIISPEMFYAYFGRGFY